MIKSSVCNIVTTEDNGQSVLCSVCRTSSFSSLDNIDSIDMSCGQRLMSRDCADTYRRSLLLTGSSQGERYPVFLILYILKPGKRRVPALRIQKPSGWATDRKILASESE